MKYLFKTIFTNSIIFSEILLISLIEFFFFTLGNDKLLIIPWKNVTRRLNGLIEWRYQIRSPD